MVIGLLGPVVVVVVVVVVFVVILGLLVLFLATPEYELMVLVVLAVPLASFLVKLLVLALISKVVGGKGEDLSVCDK